MHFIVTGVFSVTSIHNLKPNTKKSLTNFRFQVSIVIMFKCIVDFQSFSEMNLKVNQNKKNELISFRFG